jgi:uncharacterized alpha-E superfamily protein
MLSRVADALYWMGRYVERAENVTRLLLVTDDFATEALGLDERLAESAWKDLFVIFPAAQVAPTVPAFAPLALPYLRDFFAFGKNPYSVSYSLRRARENARGVREALTLEVYVVLNETHRALEVWERKPPPDLPGLRDALTSVHRGVFSIVGTIDHTLPRDEGWLFLRLGETLERLNRAAFVLRAKLPGLLVPPAASDVPLYQAGWRTLLRSLASLEHFRRIYGASLEPDTVVPFLLFDAQSPRSLRYGAEALKTHLEAIAGPHDNTPAARLIGRLAAELRYTEDHLLKSPDFAAFLDHITIEVGKIHDALDARFFVT